MQQLCLLQVIRQPVWHVVIRVHIAYVSATGVLSTICSGDAMVQSIHQVIYSRYLEGWSLRDDCLSALSKNNFNIGSFFFRWLESLWY